MGLGRQDACALRAGASALGEGAYGEFEAQALMDGVDKVIASHLIELFVFRPELSMNVPEPGGN